MKTESTERLAYLLDLLCDILGAHPEGLSEYDLLCALDAYGEKSFSSQVFETNHGLFEAHFLLFHHLYALKDHLVANQSGCLQIDCTKIVLGDYQEVRHQVPALHDPMKTYYSDLSNLQNTSEQDVQVMLDSFWNRFRLWSNRAHALDVLGLEDPVEPDVVRRRYHELAMQHHPDRGGDQTKLQEINAAMAALKR